MTPDAWLIGAELAVAVALIALGAATALAAANAAKQLAGVQIGMLGACIGLACVHAPVTFVVATIAVALVYLALGVAAIVRMQEAYGGVETPEIDAADRQDEAAEPER